MLPLLQLLVIWKRNTIYSLKRFCICFPFPISSRILKYNEMVIALQPKIKLYLSDSKSLHFAGMSHMGTLAKVNEGTTPTSCVCYTLSRNNIICYLYTVVVGVLTRSLRIRNLNLLYYTDTSCMIVERLIG